MKIVALEEHIATREIRELWDALPDDRREDIVSVFEGRIRAGLEEWADVRLAAMDDAGVDVQVLSLTTPGPNSLDAADAVAIARDVNDVIAAAVAAHPTRFEGFAALPTPAPDAAAEELERAVRTLGLRGAMLYGRTLDRNADSPEFEPIYATAADLGVPLYLHPQLPVRAVRDAYYNGYEPFVSLMFADGGLGWHYEAGVQTMRLILSGVFDRHPDLQLILGHWGEVVLFYLDRIAMIMDRISGLDRPIRDYFRDNIHYTPSGVFSQPYLQNTIAAVGVERVMFSVDHPFHTGEQGAARAFLEEADLTDDEKALIGHGNWERLCARRKASR
jgi:predicted TIM-barrel fold metal-dependent hydrolase